MNSKRFVDPGTDYLVIGQVAAAAYRRLSGRLTASVQEVRAEVLTALPDGQFVALNVNAPSGHSITLRLLLASCKVACNVNFIRAYDGEQPRRAPDGKKNVVFVKQIWPTGTARPFLPPNPNYERPATVRTRIRVDQKQEDQPMNDAQPELEEIRVAEAPRLEAQATPQQVLENAEAAHKKREEARQVSRAVRGELLNVEQALGALNDKLHNTLPFLVFQQLSGERESLVAQKKALEKRLGDINDFIRSTLPDADHAGVRQILATLTDEVRDMRHEFAQLRETVTRYLDHTTGG